MTKYSYILVLFIFGCFSMHAQVYEAARSVEIKGSVQGKEDYAPISGVEVSTDKGAFAQTNSRASIISPQRLAMY
jgi:hypothetical protein